MLLPASMKLLGDWNWYLPSWLEWLPEVAPEPATRHAELYPSRLAVDVERADGRVSLALRGELDLETAPLFRERIVDAEAGAATVVIDVRQVTFVDSCGIGELVGADQRSRREGRRLVVLKDDETQIAQVLQVADLDQALDITADAEEARAPRA